MAEALSDRELDLLTEVVAAWASARPDVRAVAMVGSYARGLATADSDVDFVVLTADPETYVEDDEWIGSLDEGNLIATKSWGAITERRLRRPNGLEIEVGIGQPTWAAVDPVDPGTARVVRDGMRIVYDPDGLLQRLVAACS